MFINSLYSLYMLTLEINNIYLHLFIITPPMNNLNFSQRECKHKDAAISFIVKADFWRTRRRGCERTCYFGAATWLKESAKAQESLKTKIPFPGTFRLKLKPRKLKFFSSFTASTGSPSDFFMHISARLALSKFQLIRCGGVITKVIR